MSRFLRPSLLVAVAVAGTVATTASASPPADGRTSAAVARAASAPSDPCTQTLNPARRVVYRYKSGARTLGFGRVVVTPTKAQPFNFCVQVQFGGREVLHDWGDSGYRRENGAWVNEGSRGSGAYRVTKDYTQGYRIPKHYRIDSGYGIRWRGTWYSTRFSRSRL